MVAALKEAERVATCLVCVLLATAGVGCSDDTSTAGGGGAGGDGGGSSNPASYLGSDCGVCVSTQCEDAIDACATDPGCATYLDCLFECPVTELGDADPTCDAACAAGGSSETERLRAGLAGCRAFGAGATECAECGVPTTPQDDTLNQVCEPRKEEPPTPCRACYWEKCCDTWDACYNGENPDCDALATCVIACEEQELDPCVSACFEEHPDSVATLLEQSACSVSQCNADQVDCNEAARDACDVCIYETCGDPFVEMLGTGEGYLLWLCLADCGESGGGVPCTEACFEAHPDGAEDAFLWGECIEVRCESLC